MSQADAPTTGNDTSPRPVLNVWSFLSLAMIAGAVVGVTVYVVYHYDAATDAGTILGIVVPVFATVGAAIFGVHVGYQTGTRTGEATGKAKGHADAADLIESELGEAGEDPIIQAIRTQGVSPTGADYYVLGAPDSQVRIPHAHLEQSGERHERLRGAVRALRSL